MELGCRETVVNDREMLMGVLGYSEKHYNKLQETGIIGEQPKNPVPRPSLTLDDYVRYGRLAYHDPDYKQKLGI